MDWLEVFQTVGICANSILLFVIAYMIFTVGWQFLPPTEAELEEMRQNQQELEADDETTVVYIPSAQRRRQRGKRSKKK